MAVTFEEAQAADAEYVALGLERAMESLRFVAGGLYEMTSHPSLGIAWERIRENKRNRALTEHVNKAQEKLEVRKQKMRVALLMKESGSTLDQIGEYFGLTRERVRQIIGTAERFVLAGHLDLKCSKEQAAVILKRIRKQQAASNRWWKRYHLKQEKEQLESRARQAQLVEEWRSHQHPSELPNFVPSVVGVQLSPRAQKAFNLLQRRIECFHHSEAGITTAPVANRPGFEYQSPAASFFVPLNEGDLLMGLHSSSFITGYGYRGMSEPAVRKLRRYFKIAQVAFGGG